MLGFLFDFLYHLFVVLIFSAVVSGIIIDAFAELRAKNNVIMDESNRVAAFEPGNEQRGGSARPARTLLWHSSDGPIAVADRREHVLHLRHRPGGL